MKEGVRIKGEADLHLDLHGVGVLQDRNYTCIPFNSVSKVLNTQASMSVRNAQHICLFLSLPVISFTLFVSFPYLLTLYLSLFITLALCLSVSRCLSVSLCFSLSLSFSLPLCLPLPLCLSLLFLTFSLSLFLFFSSFSLCSLLYGQVVFSCRHCKPLPFLPLNIYKVNLFTF